MDGESWGFCQMSAVVQTFPVLCVKIQKEGGMPPCQCLCTVLKVYC